MGSEIRSGLEEVTRNLENPGTYILIYMLTIHTYHTESYF